MKFQYPESIARFYDTIYHQVRDGVDNEFFLEEINKTQGKILEIGVGTGRHFMTALNNGADIYGIDISESMLSILYGKLPEKQRFRLSCQDIIDFSINEKFDLVIAPFRVLMHIRDKSDQLRALNNVFAHLNDNGRFIFDVFVPDLKQLINGIKDLNDFEGEYAPGKLVRRIVSTNPDLMNQTIMVSFHMEWQEGDEMKHDDWTFPMRFFFRYELEHLVERSRFSSYRIYGDYRRSELDKDSREFVVVCSK